jgi:hypothetical protein
MNPGVPLSRLSLPRDYGAGSARPFRALPAQRRLQGRDERGSTAGLDFNPMKSALAKSVANALASIKRVLLTLSYSAPGGGRQSKDDSGSSEEGPPVEERLPGPPPRFEEMTTEGILKYCDDKARRLQTSEAMAMVQRLYDIALFEHDITEGCAKKALEWIEALKRDINAVPIRDENRFRNLRRIATPLLKPRHVSDEGRCSANWRKIGCQMLRSMNI